MYSGIPLTRRSGRITGTHQKIDRIARRQLEILFESSPTFPSAKAIVRFEGLNGPDGLKRKSPAHNEPRYFIDPYDESESELVILARNHYKQLVSALKEDNQGRAAFEAAWLAHALVDGLTPAHHYPYDKEMMELRGGEGDESRNTIRKKLIISGDTRREQVKNNFKIWGPKGLLLSHGMFEMGAASIIAPMNFKKTVPTEADMSEIRELGFSDWFRKAIREVGDLGLYDRFNTAGWTLGLAQRVRHDLAPILVKTVTLAWYNAMIDAGLAKEAK